MSKETKVFFRNTQNIDERTALYLGNKIVAWKRTFEEYNQNKDKFDKKSEYICHIYRTGSKWQPLNLGECNNGDKLTSVNQAINQAKDFINCCNERGF